MAEESRDWAQLDAIWISHYHLDHCGGLPAYLFATKYAPDTQSRTKPLYIFGPPGLRQLIERFDSVNNYGLLEQPFAVEICEAEALEQFKILPGVEAVAFNTPHTPESHAIHIRDTDGATLVFTADTGFTDALAAFANRVDLFLVECSFVVNKPVDIHLNLAEVVYLARKAQPKLTVLTHLYPEWDDVDFAEEVEKFAAGIAMIEGVDGLIVNIPD